MSVLIHRALVPLRAALFSALNSALFLTLSLAVLLIAPGPAMAAPAATPLPVIAPERAGFSSEALARIDRFFAAEIQRDRLPGAVVAIARDGKLVYYKAHGFLDKARGEPMPLDAIFNLASMTKIMVSVGALKLNEEGRLPLKSRLDSYFPEFGKSMVGVVSSTGELTTVPAKQPIYIHDLFRHTSGFTYGGRGDHAVNKLYPLGSSGAAFEFTGAEFITRLASLPLLHHPGTTFEYGFSTDVLGLVIEKVSGRRLGEYLEDSVWRPLGMRDTTFVVPTQQRSRLAQPLANDPVNGKPQKIAALSGVAPKFECGGSCAFSTVADYLRFGEMLLDGGVLDGKRILSPKTVAVMTANHLGPDMTNNVPLVEPHRDGYGFGLGVAVRMNDGIAAVPGSKGDYTWNGANGTVFWADPKERLVVVMGSVGPGEIRKYYREQLGALVYGAMTKIQRSD